MDLLHIRQNMLDDLKIDRYGIISKTSPISGCMTNKWSTNVKPLAEKMWLKKLIYRKKMFEVMIIIKLCM